jgi:hypothetical protein
MSQHFYSSTMPRLTLAAPIAVADTTMTVPAAQYINLPPAYPFTLRVDPGLTSEELVDVTGPATTSGANVVVPINRGIDGSSAQAHAVNAGVEHSSVARDFNERQYGDVASAFAYTSVNGPTNGAEAVVLTTTSFTVVAGRRYRVRAYLAQVRSDNAADLSNNRLRLDSLTGTQLANVWNNIPASFVGLPSYLEATFVGAGATNVNPGVGNPMTVAAGNHTIVVTCTKNSTTGNAATMNNSGQAGQPIFLIVEDKGV